MEPSSIRMLHLTAHRSVQQLDPLLRWVGGKQALVPALIRQLPDDISLRRYIEPFAGAASLFLAVKPSRAILGDANANLISTYAQIRRSPDSVGRALRRLSFDVTRAAFYQTRDAYNAGTDTATQAARFIYLNRTAFNGVFRVNRAGNFNVPFGDSRTPRFPSSKYLRSLSAILAKAELVAADYRIVLRRAAEGDFVYLDPPYPPLTATSNFTRYTATAFCAGDHVALATEAAALSARGCAVLVSNADTPLIRHLYRGFKFRTISVKRHVTCKKQKHEVRELLITKY